MYYALYPSLGKVCDLHSVIAKSSNATFLSQCNSFVFSEFVTLTCADCLTGEQTGKYDRVNAALGNGYKGEK